MRTEIQDPDGGHVTSVEPRDRDRPGAVIFQDGNRILLSGREMNRLIKVLNQYRVDNAKRLEARNAGLPTADRGDPALRCTSESSK
jgi:hypothetical protein